MQHYGPQDVVEMDDYAAAASMASGGAPVGRAPGGHVSYPLYGVGQAPPPVPGNGTITPILTRLKWPVVGFVLGLASMGGAWFYFGHWRPLKQKANRRKR